MEDHKAAVGAVDWLRELGVNYVGIDFDNTFISTHTDGKWNRTAEDLAIFARAELRVLIDVLQAAGIHIAIVTFSKQTDLIENVLRIVLGAPASEMIIVRASDGSWGTSGNTYLEGKQRFLASAAEEFERRHCITISRNTTLLIDDDVRNINIALDKGVRAVWLNPDHPQTLMAQIKALPV